MNKDFSIRDTRYFAKSDYEMYVRTGNIEFKKQALHHFDDYKKLGGKLLESEVLTLT